METERRSGTSMQKLLCKIHSLAAKKRTVIQKLQVQIPTPDANPGFVGEAVLAMGFGVGEAVLARGFGVGEAALAEVVGVGEAVLAGVGVPVLTGVSGVGEAVPWV